MGAIEVEEEKEIFTRIGHFVCPSRGSLDPSEIKPIIIRCPWICFPGLNVCFEPLAETPIASNPGVAHVGPGSVSRPEQVLREGGDPPGQAVGFRRGLVDTRILAGEQGGMGGQGPKVRGHGLVKASALLGEGFQGRTGGFGIPIGGEGVGTGGVEHDQNHVGSIGLLAEFLLARLGATEGRCGG